MICKKCNKQSSKEGNFCPHCGAMLEAENSIAPSAKVELNTPSNPQEASAKKKGNEAPLLFLAILIVLGSIALLIFASPRSPQHKVQPTNNSNTSSQTAPTPPKVDHHWIYDEQTDTIHNNAKIKFARTSSSNTLNFKFPYEGRQHALLMLRKNYDGSKDVIISIERGQFITSLSEGKSLIRFDDGAPEEYQILPPADHSATVVFIKETDYFIKNALKSKKMYFQTTFYQEGSQTLEFNIEGLQF